MPDSPAHPIQSFCVMVELFRTANREVVVTVGKEGGGREGGRGGGEGGEGRGRGRGGREGGMCLLVTSYLHKQPP